MISGRVLFELADCSLTLVYRRYQRGAASEEVMAKVSEWVNNFNLEASILIRDNLYVYARKLRPCQIMRVVSLYQCITLIMP